MDANKFDSRMKQKIAHKIAYTLTLEYIRQNNLFIYHTTGLSSNINHYSNASSCLDLFEKIYGKFVTDLMNKNTLLDMLKDNIETWQ